MGVRIQCPMCGKGLNVPGKFAGKEIKCPQCSERIDVPAEMPAHHPYRSMGFITAATLAGLACLAAGIIIGIAIGKEREVIVEKPVEVEKVVEVLTQNRNSVIFEGEYEIKKSTPEEIERYRQMAQLTLQIEYHKFLEDPSHDMTAIVRRLDILSHPESDVMFLDGTYDVELTIGDETRSFPASMAYARSKSGELTVVSGAEFKDFLMTRADRLKNKKLGL